MALSCMGEEENDGASVQRKTPLVYLSVCLSASLCYPLGHSGKREHCGATYKSEKLRITTRRGKKI